MIKALGLITANYGVAHPSVLVENRPVASLPFLGRFRLVDFPLSNMVNAGIRTVGLIMPSNYRSLVDHVGSGKDWDLDRKEGGLFVMPGSPFGTSRQGGRFLVRDLELNKQLFERNHQDYVVMSSCNFIYNVDIKQLLDEHVAEGADITLITRKTTEPNPNVLGLEFEDGKLVGKKYGVDFGETGFIDLAIFNRELLLNLIDSFGDLEDRDLICALVESGEARHLKIIERHFNGYITTIFDTAHYYRANMDQLNPKVLAELSPKDRFIKTKAHDNAPAKYEPGSHVTNSLVSAGDRIYGTVTDSVLSRDVIVEAGATVRNSIIMQGVIIRSGALITNAIVDRGNVIEPGTELRGTRDNILVMGKVNE
ncbi:MAG: glucose-1-phosphate adenylyltransferase subunit GlgD [Atopobiaceae bacterium]|jgi:glucose-1-phosphate adenylyltransferase